MINWCICWFFTHIFTGDYNFKGFTARRLYKSFGVVGLISHLSDDEAGLFGCTVWYLMTGLINNSVLNVDGYRNRHVTAQSL
jgi:hypothetical protein